MAGRPSKPAPDIFLLALDSINRHLARAEPEIQPSECLVFEDSTAGVEAGLRSGMRVVWVPHTGLREVYKGKETFVLSGRSDCLDDEGDGGTALPGIMNGECVRRAEVVESLEHFPLDQFGVLTMKAGL